MALGRHARRKVLRSGPISPIDCDHRHDSVRVGGDETENEFRSSNQRIWASSCDPNSWRSIIDYLLGRELYLRPAVGCSVHSHGESSREKTTEDMVGVRISSIDWGAQGEDCVLINRYHLACGNSRSSIPVVNRWISVASCPEHVLVASTVGREYPNDSMSDEKERGREIRSENDY